MATRLYFPSTGAPDITPDFDVYWDKTLEADRLEMVKEKISSSFATKQCSENVATSYWDVLNRQYVSNPIGVHDFSGCSYRAQIRCMEDAAKADFILTLLVKVVSNDGSVERGRWVVGGGILEFDDDLLVNRYAYRSIPDAPFSSQNGDRIIVEIGITALNAKTTLYTATQDFGDNSGTDLPENETETAQYCPWIEFSHDIPGLWTQVLKPGGIASLEDVGEEGAIFPSAKIKATDWKTPGTCSSVSRNGGNAWANPDNAKVYDENYAIAEPNVASDPSDWLRCTNFGFSTGDIPSGAVILGIILEIIKTDLGDSVTDSAIYLRKSTGQVGHNVAKIGLAYPDTGEAVYYGGVLTEWNSGLADSDIRTSEFGVDISASLPMLGGDAYIDRVRIRVFYTTELEATAWKPPGTVVNADRDAMPAWVDVNNAKVLDDNFADYNSPESYSDWLRCTNFGFAVGDIPSGATVEGIAVEIIREGAQGGENDSAIYLRKSTGQVGDDKAKPDDWGVPLKWAYYGYVEDTWNSSLIDSDIRTTEFGVDISVTAITVIGELAKVDRVQIRVFYTVGIGAQTLIPGGIGSLENFGTLKANLKMYPSSVGSLEAVGTPSVIQKILIPDGIASLEGFGTSKLNFKLFPEYVPSGEGHGTPRFVLKLLPSAIESLEALGEPQLNLKLLLSAIESAEAFGNTLLNLRLLMSGIGSEEAFGEPVVALMLQKLYPDGIASLEAFGDAGLNMKIFPSSVTSEEDFGTAMLKLRLLVASVTSQEGFGDTKLNHRIEPSAIGSLEAFGDAVIKLVQSLYPDGIVSSEIVGNAQLNLRLLLSAIESLETFGTANVAISQFLGVDGILTGEVFGDHTVKTVISLYPDAIGSLENFGTAKLNLRLLLSSIVSGEGFGTASVIRSLSPSAIASLEGFGTPKLNLRLLLQAIASGEAFGMAIVSGVGVQAISPDAIASLEAFGALFINLQQTVLPSGIVSVEIVPSPKLNLGIFPAGVVSGEAHGQPQLNFIIFPDGIESLEAFGFDTLLKLFPKLFKVAPRIRIFEVEPRGRIFTVKPREKVFEISPRSRTRKIDPREKVFKSDRR